MAAAVLPTLRCRAASGPPKTGQPDKSHATGLPLASKQTQCEAWDAKILDHTCSHAVGFPIRWEHYFAYVDLNRGTHDIKEGLVSLWMVLNTKSGKEMLQRLNDELLDIIAPIIYPQFWMKRFKSSPADLELVKDIVKEGKIL